MSMSATMKRYPVATFIALTLGLSLASRVFMTDDEAALSDSRLLQACEPQAARVLDRIRKAARSDNPEDDLEVLLDTLRHVSLIMHRTKGWWRVLKQYLLAFRYLDHTVLGSDLDPNPGNIDNPWTAIPREIHWILDRPWESEHGTELRRAMTHDFLEYLKPLRESAGRDLRRFDDKKDGFAPTLAEPDPDMRYAYVRAIADLGADPGESGHFHHQVLDKVAMNDPSPEVREAATKAAQVISTRSGYRRGSSKRHLLNAWWWIRQAHVIITHGTLDAEKALRRRDAEIRI